MKGTKWNRKQIKPFWSSTPFCHFLWASNRDQQVYNMRIIHDNKKLGFGKNLWVWKKKNPEFWKTSGFLKKPEIWKKQSELKKNMSFEKNLGFFKKNLSFEKKIWVLKKAWVLKKNPEFWKIWVLKKLELLQRKNYRSENKTPNLKIIRFTIQISQNK